MNANHVETGRAIGSANRPLYPDSLDTSHCYAAGESDGWPITPVTDEAVAAMLAEVENDPDEVLGKLPPVLRTLRVYDVAVNAVRAGCKPEQMPVVLAAAKALIDPALNIHGAATHTGGTAPIMIVNGPLAAELGFNASYGVFGPGSRANATVGRAVRLLLRNVGGALPGVLDQADFGHPGKHTFCIAENEQASPWAPFHVDRGLQPEQSAVTLFPCVSPNQVANNVSQDGETILSTIADSMARLGTANMTAPGEYVVVIGVEHATTLAKQGWTKQAVKEYLFTHATRPVRDIVRVGLTPRLVPPTFESADELRSSVRGPEDVLVLVAGGPAGKFSAVMSGRCGNHGSHPVTVPFARTTTRRIADRSRSVAVTRSTTPATIAAAPRVRSLSGVRVGLVDNSKVNSNVIVERLGELLSQTYGAEPVLEYRKPSSSIPIVPEVLADLAGKCDVVINGVGDCGSSSSTSVSDGIALENLGMPTVTLCTDRFKLGVATMAEMCGMPGYDVIFVEHPMANLTRDEARGRAEHVIESVVANLVPAATEQAVVSAG